MYYYYTNIDFNELENVEDFPTTDDAIDKSIFTAIDINEEQTIPKNKTNYINTDLKCIYALKFGDKDYLVVKVPLMKITTREALFNDTNKKYKEYTVHENLVNHRLFEWDYDFNNGNRYIPSKDICSKYLSRYIDEIIFEKCSILRYKVTIIAKIPTLGKTGGAGYWKNDYKTDLSSNSLSELQNGIIFESIKDEVKGLTKSVVLKLYNDFSSAGIKVSVNGASDFNALVAPIKKNKNSSNKLMTLKINGRVISYDSFKKAFTCKIGKNDCSDSEFDDNLCSSIVREASVHISFDNSQYSDDCGFSYTLTLVSNDAPKDTRSRYNEEGVTHFYAIEDENIFDIVRKFRELNIPVALTGIKKLLNIYERTKKLADIINEDFPEDVLMAQIDEEGIRF